MKATGIVRRIDDLGRVVIPKEIRRTMRIREGDPLEIYTDKEGGVIFKKYSLMGGLGDFAGQMCETLNKTTGRMAIITDRDTCLAVSGAGKRELTDKRISAALEQVMEDRGDLSVPERPGAPARQRREQPLFPLLRRPHPVRGRSAGLRPLCRKSRGAGVQRHRV